MDTFVTKLSQRHRRVAEYVRGGLTNKEIARELGLSTHTVNTYVREALLVTGARNRAQLAIMVGDETTNN